MQIQISNSRDELAGVMTALEDFVDSAGLDAGAAQAAELALDELLANIISYGYLDLEVHQITVEFDVIEGAMIIRLVDDGIPFNPFDQDEPDLGSCIERREIGGVGIHLVKNFMDDYSYERNDEHNIVTLSKTLTSA